MNERREPVIEGFITTGPEPPRPGGWYLRLPLIGLSEAQTRRLREQALQGLDHYGDSQRAIVRGAFASIVEATEQRLGMRRPPNAGPPANVFLLDIVPDESDPWSQIRDDRGTVVAFALRFADDSDETIGTIWRGIAEQFDIIRFAGRA